MYNLNNFLSASTSYFLALTAVSLLRLSQLFIWLIHLVIVSLLLMFQLIIWPIQLSMLLTPLIIFFSVLLNPLRDVSSLLYWIFRLLKQLRLEIILGILLNYFTLGLWQQYWISITQTGIFLRFPWALIQLLGSFLSTPGSMRVYQHCLILLFLFLPYI